MKAFVFTVIINFALLSATAVGLAHVSGDGLSQEAPTHHIAQSTSQG